MLAGPLYRGALGNLQAAQVVYSGHRDRRLEEQVGGEVERYPQGGERRHMARPVGSGGRGGWQRLRAGGHYWWVGIFPCGGVFPFLTTRRAAGETVEPG